MKARGRIKPQFCHVCQDSSGPLQPVTVLRCSNISGGIRDCAAVLRFVHEAAQAAVFPMGAHRCCVLKKKGDWQCCHDQCSPVRCLQEKQCFPEWNVMLRSAPHSLNLLIIDIVTCYSCHSQFLQLSTLHCQEVFCPFTELAFAYKNTYLLQWENYFS